MTDLPRALALSFAQLADPAVLRVLAKSLLATAAISVVLGLALWRGLAWLLEGYAAPYAEWGGALALLATVLGAWLLFRIVALAVLQFFADDVVRAVERRHYPAQAAVPDVPFTRELKAGAAGAVRTLAVNAVVLPVALVLLVTGVGAALVLWAANAWLLGRELTEMVALRHRGSVGAAPLDSGTRFALGGTVAALLAVPFVNLLAPILGAAAATHLFHRRRLSHG